MQTNGHFYPSRNHSAAANLFGKLQQRKGARQYKERGGEKYTKKKIECKQMDIPLPITPLLRLWLVNYSREREQDRTKKKEKKKDRKYEKEYRM
jgi:hypothetical protein